MPTLDQMLNPRCPNHPQYVAEPCGVCWVCTMLTHRHLRVRQEMSPAAQRMREHLLQIAGNQRVTYRTEAEAYDEGIYDDD